MKNKEDEKYYEKITDEDFNDLEKFQKSFIRDLESKEQQWLIIKADIQDEYLRLRDKMNKTDFKNDIIRGIEQGRLSEYLKEAGRLGREGLNLGVFIERIKKDEHNKYWLFKTYNKEFKNIKDDLSLLLLEIFKNTEIYEKFINITFQCIVLKDTDNFYNSFLYLLDLYTQLPFKTKSDYSKLLTELLFDTYIAAEKKKPTILTSTGTKYGTKIQYKRSNKTTKK